MGKHKSSLQTHHLYLSAGGMLAVAALVIALTFGLSSAEHEPDYIMSTTCPTGYTGTPPNCTSTTQNCPAGYTGTPPNCTSTCTSPAYWDTASATCKTSTVDPAAACATAGGTYNAANSPPCTMPGSQTCPTGQWWDMAMNSGAGGCRATTTAVQCDWTTQYTRMSDNTCQPKVNCTTVGNIDYNTSECQGVRNAATTGGMTCTSNQHRMPVDTAHPQEWCMEGVTHTTATVGSCTTGQYWDAASSTCKSSTSGTDPQADCTRAYGTWKPADSGHPQSWCDMGAAGGQQGTQWTTNRTECPSSKPISCQANNAYTCTVTQIECDGYRNVGQQPRSCPGGQHLESGNCVPDQAFRTCGPNEQPTTNNPCSPAGGSELQYGQACPSDQYRDSSGACVPMSQRQPYEQPRDQGQLQPGQCPQDMQQCPDQWDSSRTVCMPKQLTWDSKTNTRVDPPRPATCADFAPPPMPAGQGQGQGQGDRFRPPFGMQTGQRFDFGDHSREGMGMEGQGRPMNPCEVNPNDPFCQFGFDFNKFGDEHSFDETQFDSNQYEIKNAMGDIKRLQRESKKWARDAQDARRQLKEISRESGGFACPAASEVDALASELEKAVNQVQALNENSSPEDIKRGLALNDFVYGRYDPETGEQTAGIQGKLFGGPPDPETGEPTPGKIQSLNVCRELSGVIFGACQAYKEVSKQFENIKENAPAEAIAVFEEVLPKLKERCENPLAVLQRKGVSLDVLSKPWYPDPDVCSFGGFGGGFPGGSGGFPGGPGGFPGGPGGFPGGPGGFPGGPGGFPGGPGGFPGGPGGFPGGPGGFPGGGFPGGGDFGPPMGGGFGDMPPEMMEMMKQKMQEFQSSGRFGFNSVLMAPSHPVEIDFDEDDFDEDFDEDFGDDEGFGFGPPEIPDECKPPVMRYLGLDEIMKKLDAIRPLMASHFESMNACKMFEMGNKMAGREGGRFGGPPPEVKNLMAMGLKACEAGDTELVDKIKVNMMRFARHPTRTLTGAIDVDQAFTDKFKDKFKQLVGDDDSEVAALQKQIAALQGQLSEAQKMIFALKEEIANLGANLTAVLGKAADDSTMRAVATLGDLPNSELSATKVADVTEILATVQAAKEAVAEALPAKDEAKAIEAIDMAVKSIVLSPPSDQILSDINESLVAIQSYASSGADSKEIIKKVQEEAAAVLAVNNSDTSNKVVEGMCASLDTCNHGDWYSIWALKATDAGLTDPKAQEYMLKPAQETTVERVVVRAVNLACENGVLEDCPDKPKTEVDARDAIADAQVPDSTSWWAAEQWKVLVENNPEAAEVLSDLSPGETATREEVAAIMATALDLPEVSAEQRAEVLPDDAQKSQYASYIAEAVSAGFMSTTDGEHFTPGQHLTVSQDLVIATNANEYLREQGEEGIGNPAGN